MSIEGIANYEHFHYVDERPVWVRLERIDYCDQNTPSRKDGWMSRITDLLKNLF